MSAERCVSDEAEQFTHHALEVWGVYYPGFGGSEGNASLVGVARSARVAFAALKARASGKRIFVFGTSMGTTAARTEALAIFVMSSEDEIGRHKYHRLVADAYAYARKKHLMVMKGAFHHSPIDPATRAQIEQVLEGWFAEKQGFVIQKNE